MHKNKNRNRERKTETQLFHWETPPSLHLPSCWAVASGWALQSLSWCKQQGGVGVGRAGVQRLWHTGRWRFVRHRKSVLRFSCIFASEMWNGHNSSAHTLAHTCTAHTCTAHTFTDTHTHSAHTLYTQSRHSHQNCWRLFWLHQRVTSPMCHCVCACECMWVLCVSVFWVRYCCCCCAAALYVVEYFYSLLNSIFRAFATRRPQGKSALPSLCCFWYTIYIYLYIERCVW